MLLLGEEYASTMGLNLHRTRSLIYLSTILLAGTVTAFCGPIGFIGLAMPHVARLLSATADHRALLPTTALAGAAAMLLCDIIAKIFVLPINAIMSLIGIPIVIWIVLRKSISL
jgi:iron complex transport system permease protein